MTEKENQQPAPDTSTVAQAAAPPDHPRRHPSRRGQGYISQRGSIWWAQYSFRGKVYRESSGSPHRADAVKLLRRRHAEIGKGQLIGPDVEKTTFHHMEEILLNEYRMNRRKSLGRVKSALIHLREAFGRHRAVEITSDVVTAYIVRRQEAQAANATVNRELAALRRAFRLAKQAGKVEVIPYIPLLREDNARKGFFEAGDFRTMLAHLPDDLKPAFEVAYVTGWRIRSELLTRQKSHVDLQNGWLRLEPGETKNGKGRMFPLTPELRTVLERQLARTREIEKATGQLILWLFHHDGQPIKGFRRAWLSACKKAGVPGRIPHDLRRSAVRNLERAGVPRSTAMEMVGHRTESVYRRYAINDETMLREGGAKLAALHQAEREQSPKVLPLNRS